MHQLAPEAPRIRFGPYELDVRSGELRKGPTRLKVPDQSIAILRALVERPGELVTRDELRQRLWPANTFVDFEHGLNAAVRRLRDALNDSADAPKFIETLPRRGYRFVGQIHANAPTEPPTVEPIPPPPAVGGAPLPSTGEPSPVTSRTRRWPIVVVAAAAALALAVGLWLNRRSGVLEGPPATPPTSTPLTSFPGVETDPAVSPDGNHVAFAWDRNSGRDLDIYVMLIGGGEPVQITRDAAVERGPAWSPDGRRLAFLRTVERTRSAIVVAPALGGGSERKLTEIFSIPLIDPSLAVNWLTWTPDGDAILFVDLVPETGMFAIFRCAVETGERRQVTQPTNEYDATSPAISPDGRYLAFVRRVASLLPGEIVVQRFGDRGQVVGDPRQLTHEARAANVVWSSDGSSLIYDRGGRWESGLWRVSVAGGTPQPLVINVRGARPSLGRGGTPLVYQLTTTDMNIWRSTLPVRPGEQARDQIQIAPSTSSETSPQFSPDGRRVAFISGRTGNPELWVANSDGSNPAPVTSNQTFVVGSPRWSPRGDAIVVDSPKTGSSKIYVVSLADGRMRPITSGRSRDMRPSWSGNGRWIYFGSDRSGTYQVWKAPAEGGDAVQVTRNGGLEAFEGPDGKILYYTRADAGEGIWEVPPAGGVERLAAPLGSFNYVAVTARGIFIIRPTSDGAVVHRFDFTTRQVSLVTSLPAGTRLGPSSPVIAVTRDGTSMVHVQFDQWGSDIHMLEGTW
jgi:Tol biopolymer transport system component/DNA-binding winged helix-turn-helix (wHTH) protein